MVITTSIITVPLSRTIARTKSADAVQGAVLGGRPNSIMQVPEYPHVDYVPSPAATTSRPGSPAGNVIVEASRMGFAADFWRYSKTPSGARPLVLHCLLGWWLSAHTSQPYSGVKAANDTSTAFAGNAESAFRFGYREEAIACLRKAVGFNVQSLAGAEQMAVAPGVVSVLSDPLPGGMIEVDKLVVAGDDSFSSACCDPGC